MVMLHLFAQAGLPFAVAHCNFQLRGDESDQDEALVRNTAHQLQAPFHVTRFDTSVQADTPGQSTQMVARQLRYDWLEDIRQQKGYAYIATAHHLNDSVETLLYNLIRGTGIRGVQGIPHRNDYVLRPLSFATRQELADYQKQHCISYREDASNAEDKYQRNKIRRHVLPTLKKINPSLEQTMADTFVRFQETGYWLDWAVRQIKGRAFRATESGFELALPPILEHLKGLPTLLYEILSPYGLNSGQATQLAQAVAQRRTGALFHTLTHTLLVDREVLVGQRFTPTADEAPSIFIVPKEVPSVSLPDGSLLRVRWQEGQPKHLPEEPHTAFLSAGLLKWPLTARHWQPGDRFQPLGMKGKHQKLQDFFSNNKLSRFEKERIWILEDAEGRICWVIGHRIDHRFRVTSDTTAHWDLTWQQP